MNALFVTFSGVMMWELLVGTCRTCVCGDGSVQVNLSVLKAEKEALGS